MIQALPASSVVADRTVETHVSVLTFTGDVVHKAKKPISLPFIDLRSAEQRRDNCQRELALNRRLAPDVYLAVEEVHGPDGALLDASVVMRRLPEERRLATLAQDGRRLHAEIRAIAHALVSFHSRAQRSAAIDALASAAALRRRWDDDLLQLRAFAGAVLDPVHLDEIAALAHRFLAGRGELLQNRVATGHSCDGHGDLLAEDIFCLPDGPRVLDCVEFDDELRYGDVLADVAFLVMDLERMERPDLARQLIADYAELSGERIPQSLLSFYTAHRALVRCKIACIRARQGASGADGKARALMALALRHLETARVRLVVVGGLPGSGKTTTCARVASALDWIHLRTDEVRHDVAGVARDAHRPASFDEGLYSAPITVKTYTAMLERAESLLRHGDSVLLDGTFVEERWRVAARRLASVTDSDIAEIECIAPPEVLHDRLTARGQDSSDATPRVAERLARRQQPWDAARRLDTTVDSALVLVRALRFIGESA
jgi:aminoglycoside phosphotransferase family enzyme/predicted kinase